MNSTHVHTHADGRAACTQCKVFASQLLSSLPSASAHTDANSPQSTQQATLGLFVFALSFDENRKEYNGKRCFFLLNWLLCSCFLSFFDSFFIFFIIFYAVVYFLSFGFNWIVHRCISFRPWKFWVFWTLAAAAAVAALSEWMCVCLAVRHHVDTKNKLSLQFISHNNLFLHEVSLSSSCMTSHTPIDHVVACTRCVFASSERDGHTICVAHVRRIQPLLLLLLRVCRVFIYQMHLETQSINSDVAIRRERSRKWEHGECSVLVCPLKWLWFSCTLLIFNDYELPRRFVLFSCFFLILVKIIAVHSHSLLVADRPTACC